MADPTQVAVEKSDAKTTADATVATDPSAIHAVQSMATSHKTLTSTAAGAGVGFMFGGPPGALVGAGVGWAVEKYRIAGGPIGKVWDWVKTRTGQAHIEAAKAAAVSPVPTPSAPPGPAVAPPAAK